MNRLLAFAVMLSVAVFLTGCHSDEKQAAKIHEAVKESAEFEQHFVANQLELYEARKKAQLVYMDLIDLDIHDEDVIHEKIEEANTYTEKQQKLLEEAKENFQKAYEKSVKMEKNIKRIQDEHQKNQASKLLTIMNKRKELMDAFFEDYHENLALQKSFYQHLADGKLSIETLDEQVDEMNKRSQEMGEIMQEFNQYTKQYVEVEKGYYEMNQRKA